MRKDLRVFCPTDQVNYFRFIFARGLETRQHIGMISKYRKLTQSQTAIAMTAAS
jgi:hypothetical protein